MYTMIDAKEMKKLQTHSKKHEGGMKSKHMQNMKKFMIAGDSFIVAHGKAKRLDKPKADKPKMEKKKSSY